MPDPSGTDTQNLRSRIDQLRERIVSLHETLTPSAPASLSRRASRVAHQLEADNWENAREGLSFAGETLLPESKSVPSTSLSAGDFARRVQDLVGQIAPLRDRLRDLGASTALSHRPVERLRWLRAKQLVELVDSMIDETRSNVRRQISLLPVWEATIERANEQYAEAAGRAVWFDRRRHQVASLREFYAQLLAGNRPTMPAVTELAGRILQDVDEEPYPEHLEATTHDPAELVAVHAVNVAHVVSFLAAMDPIWRSHRLSLAIAALFMDVGMLETAGPVLTSPHPLSVEERSAVERHAIASSLIAERVQGLDSSLVRAIGSHHERLDGTGYPSGRRGEEIPVPARLLSAADMYVAMRSRRSHRTAHSPKDALTMTLAEAEAGRLDLDRTRGLLNLSLYPVGSVVELSTGEIAEVVAPQNAIAQPTLAAQPFVRLLIDRKGHPVLTRTFRNLAVRPDTRVARTLSVEETELVRRAR
jgi:HD-GYP domain-containing protein (c-di-GMP phosphodiesterase class II)